MFVPFFPLGTVPQRSERSSIVSSIVPTLAGKAKGNKSTLHHPLISISVLRWWSLPGSSFTGLISSPNPPPPPPFSRKDPGGEESLFCTYFFVARSHARINQPGGRGVGGRKNKDFSSSDLATADWRKNKASRDGERSRHNSKPNPKDTSYSASGHQAVIGTKTCLEVKTEFFSRRPLVVDAIAH